MDQDGGHSSQHGQYVQDVQYWSVSSAGSASSEIMSVMSFLQGFWEKNARRIFQISSAHEASNSSEAIPSGWKYSLV